MTFEIIRDYSKYELENYYNLKILALSNILLFSTYFLIALHLYLKIKITATNIVKIATKMFISSTRHSVVDCESFSGTWNIVPFSARQNQTIRFTGLGNIRRNLYRLQKSISILCNVSDNYTRYHLYDSLELHLEKRIFMCHIDQMKWSIKELEKKPSIICERNKKCVCICIYLHFYRKE